ncbi:hypothetical protein ACI2OX_18220 [Bacillus sp. N9]
MPNEISICTIKCFFLPGRERVKIEKAWEQFVSGEKSASTVRSLTYQSWERSLKYGVHPLHGRAPIRLTEDKIQEYQSLNPFYSTKESLLTRLKESAVHSGYLLTFCNPHGEILSIDGNPLLKEKAQEMNFIVGSSWSEQHIGTNGMGTSLAIGSPFKYLLVSIFVNQYIIGSVQHHRLKTLQHRTF